jgi:ABC-type polysaccharide/polyol phosphate transport system ATPase subunit
MLSQICDRILVLEQGETIVLDEADISIKIYQRLIKS